jgi:hypothetical protein
LPLVDGGALRARLLLAGSALFSLFWAPSQQLKKRLIYRPWNEPITELLKISDRQTRFSLAGKACQPIEEESD